MEIRLLGTPTEIQHAVRALEAGFLVRSVSPFHPNRGRARLGRVYVDAVPRHVPTSSEE